ncbi:MAG: AAA family ATPase [Planctomycetota bacterium]|nr:AAA family ATPase [Planctomycetota bacterium]MDI6787922.1 AAA family ATPase [Planctomycetota bacterium]
MSYYKILGLTTEPFSSSPDPLFFYESNSHKRALNRLLIELNLRRGLSVILGDIGTGKTTLSRKLVQNLGEREEFTYQIILDPVYENEWAFLDALVRTLGVETTTLNLAFSGLPITESKLKDMLKSHLFEKAINENKGLVLIIDEAQKLSEPSLEVLRILLNYETNQAKLLQLVLLGQAELQTRLNHMPNLVDRISSLHILNPLDQIETEKMIGFRLHQAGYREKIGFFTREAVNEIYQDTQGYPRQVTLLCHKALTTMVGLNKKVVDGKLIKEIIEEETRKRMPLETKASPAVVLPASPSGGPLQPAVPSGGARSAAAEGESERTYGREVIGRTKSVRKRNALKFALVSILGCAALAFFGLNYFPKIGSKLFPPTQTQPDQNRLALTESYYQTMVNDLKEEQKRTNNLIAELTMFKNEIKDEFKNTQQSSSTELSNKIALLEKTQELIRDKISLITEEISKVQSRTNEDNKELGIYLMQLKENFETLDNKLHNLAEGLAKSSLLPGQAIPEGFYVIRILEAFIAPSD